jgi:D-galactose 1-dehydrogenase
MSYILPAPVFVESATLDVPANKAAPIAARLSFKASDGLPADLKADFDWRQEGEQTWDITTRLADGRVLKLSKGGSRLDIDWKEYVRRWHPGQEWIWEPGGFGVFDPGINALSIVSYVLPAPIFVTSAELTVPSNKAAPIAAKLTFKASDGLPADIKAEFDWRQLGEQTWNITTTLADGRVLKLSKGGARLEIDGHLMVEETPAEYEAIYEHFAVLLARRQSDVDIAPLRLVADAFMVGNWKPTEPFL